MRESEFLGVGGVLHETREAALGEVRSSVVEGPAWTEDQGTLQNDDGWIPSSFPFWRLEVLMSHGWCQSSEGEAAGMNRG